MHTGGITATMIASNALLIINFKPSTALFCSTVVLNGGSAKVGGLAQIWLQTQVLWLWCIKMFDHHKPSREFGSVTFGLIGSLFKENLTTA